MQNKLHNKRKKFKKQNSGKFFLNDAIIKSIICVVFFGKTYYSCGNETLRTYRFDTNEN